MTNITRKKDNICYRHWVIIAQQKRFISPKPALLCKSYRGAFISFFFFGNQFDVKMALYSI